MSSEFQPKPIVNNEFDQQKPALGHLARKINNEQTIVGVTTLSLGSEEDPTHIASFLEAVGEPDRVTTNNDSWESRRGIFHVYMVRDSLGNAARGEPQLKTTRVLLFSTEKPKKTVYLALEDGKIYVEKKRAETAQRAQEMAELEELYKASQEENE